MTLRLSGIVVSVIFFLLCVLAEVSWSFEQVYLVGRNNIDYFRVGESGCTNNGSVCTSSATCETENGLCRCSSNKPTFRNPSVIKFNNSETVFGDSYGCVDNDLVRRAGIHCTLGPFQVIPHGPDNLPTQFSYDGILKLKSCTLTKALAKYPNSSTEIDLQWLNESFVDLPVINKILHFKWKRLVPGLKGTIITLSFLCLLDSGAYLRTCLRAKILGTWRPESTFVPTNIDPTLPSTKLSSQMTSKTFSQTAEPVGSDSNTILIVVLAVSVVLNVVLGIVTGFLCRKNHRNQRKKTNAEDEQRARRGETNTRIEMNAYDPVMIDKPSMTLGHLNNGNLSDKRVSRDEANSRTEMNLYDPVMIDKPFTTSGHPNNGNLSGKRARRGNTLSGTERNPYDQPKIAKSFTWSGQHDNGNSQDQIIQMYEESKYQPLQRNHLQDQIEEHTYQGLATLRKGNQPHLY